MHNKKSRRGRKLTFSASLMLFLAIVPLSVSAAFTRPLFLGVTGPDVSELQTILKDKGFFTYPSVTGYYGPITLQAVAVFQKSEGLDPIGYVGPMTRAILNGLSTATLSPAATLTNIVIKLQTLLAAHGFYGSTPSGIYDMETIKAVEKFQEDVKDGRLGYSRVRGGGNATNSTPSDTTVPVISSVSSGTPSDTTATITWQTDESADSQVEYGTTTAYGATTALNSTLTTSHSVNLSGLIASTTYHYRVRSADSSANIAYSSDATFMTSAIPDTTAPVISNITVATTTTTATITWETDEAASSRVNYGLNDSYGSVVTGSSNVTDHSLLLTGLIGGTMYHYQIQSADSAGNIATSSDGTLVTPWVLVDSILDMDFENDRYSYNGTEYETETAVLNALGGSQTATNTRIIGPYTFGSNLLTNGDFSDGTTGWATTSVSGSPSFSVVDGEAVVDGNGANAPGILATFPTTAGRAYRFEGKSRAPGSSTNVAASWFSNFGASATGQPLAGPTASYVTASSTIAATGGTTYIRGRATASSFSSQAFFDDFTVHEALPFNGLVAGEISGRIEATTPSSASGDKVLWQTGDRSERNRIRVVWDSSSHLRFIVTYNNVSQANIDLGVVDPSTPFVINFSAGPDLFFASLNDEDAVYAPVGTTPGFGVMWVGRSFTGETWDGSIQRVTIWPTGSEEADYLVGWGDSLTFGTGATIYPTDTWIHKLAMSLNPARRVSNQGVGGETSNQVKNRLLAGISAFDNTAIFTIWAGYNNHTNPTGVESDIATMVAALPSDSKYLVIGIPNGENVNQYQGGSSYTHITGINSNLSSTYGERYVPMREHLISLYNPSDPQDVIDYGRDIVPSSLRSDTIHHNNAGHAAIAAYLEGIIEDLGW